MHVREKGLFSILGSCATAQLRNSHDRCEGALVLFGGCSMSGDAPGSSPILDGLLAPYPIIQAMWRALNGAGG